MPQHVIQRGNNRSVIFLAHADYRFFRDCLREACDLHGCKVHAYVFMSNHVHLLMTPTTASGIGDVMQDVGRRYVRRFNDTHQRTGTLWEGRYKATLVETEQYLLACYRYIELNPVRAGLVKDPRDYRWSSYRANGMGVRDPIVASHQRYEALGVDAPARLRAYRELFADALPAATLEVIRDSTNHGWALGSKRFRDDIAATLSRRTQPAPQGRPVRWKDENRL
jgi:putative transposase